MIASSLRPLFEAAFGIGLAGLVSSTGFAVLTMEGARRFLTSSKPVDARSSVLPPVSLLKPLHGAEPDLDSHLATFFEQNCNSYEILFCARSADDEGLAIARRVAARYPHVPARFLSVDGPCYINAKVSSLELMGCAAAHDIFIISDSDVRVTPDYVRAVAQDFLDPKVDASTCLYRGVASEGLWSKLEAAGMSVEMTSGVLAANVMEGMRFLLGPTMAIRRAAVVSIGGFRTLGPYCSDDFLLGNQVAERGGKVVLSRHVIDHIVLNLSFSASMKHQVRWMKSTRFSRPKGHFGSGLTFSVPFGLLACAAAMALGLPVFGLSLLAYSIVARFLLAAFVGKMVVADRHSLRAALLYPMRDVMGFLFWLASYSGGTIVWRGQLYRLLENGLMQSVHTPRPLERSTPDQRTVERPS